MRVTVGGEAGIRTLGGGLPLNGFQDRRFKPLSHLSLETHYNEAISKKRATYLFFALKISMIKNLYLYTVIFNTTLFYTYRGVNFVKL